MARIVAGVDQSPGARRALAWAAQEAGLRQAVLQVVHAYHAKELAASMRDHAEFKQVYRGQAEEFLQGLLDELQEPLGGGPGAADGGGRPAPGRGAG